MRLILVLSLFLSNLGFANGSAYKWESGTGKDRRAACSQAQEKLSQWAMPSTKECEDLLEGEAKLTFNQTYVSYSESQFVCYVLGAFYCKADR